MSQLKSNNRSVKILLKEVFSTTTALNPALFEFDVWNPGGYVVLIIQGKKGTVVENTFLEKSVYVSKAQDFTLDQWKFECEELVDGLYKDFLATEYSLRKISK